MVDCSNVVNNSLYRFFAVSILSPICCFISAFILSLRLFISLYARYPPPITTPTPIKTGEKTALTVATAAVPAAAPAVPAAAAAAVPVAAAAPDAPATVVAAPKLTNTDCAVRIAPVTTTVPVATTATSRPNCVASPRHQAKLSIAARYTKS